MRAHGAGGDRRSAHPHDGLPTCGFGPTKPPAGAKDGPRSCCYSGLVAEHGAEPTVEEAVRRLKTSVARYAVKGSEPTHEAVADLAKAINEVGDHLVALHHRIDKLEEDLPEWTTRGWQSPES